MAPLITVLIVGVVIFAIIALPLHLRTKTTCNFVPCAECGCLLKKEDAQKVEGEYSTFYYCRSHKKPYSQLWWDRNEFVYEKTMRVDEKGEPVGYKKLKTKK